MGTDEDTLTSVPYDGFMDCAQQGYDFGMQLEYCIPGEKLSVDNLGQTPFKTGVDEGTCQVNNIGTFKTTCTERDMASGGLFSKATITPSFDTSVLMQGDDGGTLYKDLKAGKTYTLDISGGSDDAPPNAIREIEFCFSCGNAPPPERTGSSFGDPHIKTWGGGMFDFHGGCDLILVQAKSFAGGLGLDLHIRTKIRTWWSFIDSAVLRIGSDTLEVQGGRDNSVRYWINGVRGHLPATNTSAYLNSTLAGHKIHYKDFSAKTKQFRLDWGKDDSMSLETFGEFVRVNVRAKKGSKDFDGAAGLMGSHPTGSKVGRDGHLIWNKNEFGQEWQVRKNEPMLFHNRNGVQHPEECLIPSKMNLRQGRRRLGEILSLEEAEVACGHVSPDELFEACVSDVRATNDKVTAGLYDTIDY